KHLRKKQIFTLYSFSFCYFLSSTEELARRAHTEISFGIAVGIFCITSITSLKGSNLFDVFSWICNPAVVRSDCKSDQTDL
ncbi:MAG: hypothetical protein K5860_10010, partial [Bacteroidales bacterium]|nr:hypothetical protein [Bacteroidales bacterium]